MLSRLCVRHFVPALMLMALGFAQSNTSQNSQPNTSQNSQSNAQQNPSQTAAPGGQKPAMVLKVTSRLVVVDVVATDHHGAPVTDLKQDEFTVTEEGRDQRITHFSMVQSHPGLVKTAAAQQALAPNVYSNAPKYEANGPLNVLLLDGLNTTVRDQKSARLQMLKVLEKLPTDRPIAVFALGAKLYLLQGFTTDPTLVKAAVESFSAKPSAQLRTPTGGAPVNDIAPGALEVMQDMAPELAAQVQLFQQEAVAAQTDLRVQWTIEAMKSLARALGGMPGRKNLIWISDSFPANILPDSIDTHGNLNQRNYQLDLERMSALLGDAQIAVYPIDARNLLGNAVFSEMSNTDSQGNYMGRAMTGRGGGGVRPGGAAELNVTGNELMNARATMNTIADRTGGRAFYNTNNVEGAVRQGLDDGATYYTLSYVPENSNWDGKFRKIVVKTSRKDVKLHFRAGYYAVDPQGYETLDAQQRQRELGQLLNMDYPIATGLPFQARVVQASQKTGGKTKVEFAVDPHAISFERGADGMQHGSLECAFAVYNSEFKPLNVFGNTSTANLPPEAFEKVMKAYFPCSVVGEIPPGDYWLRLGVRDARTGLMGSLNAQVKIAAPVGDEKK